MFRVCSNLVSTSYDLHFLPLSTLVLPLLTRRNPPGRRGFRLFHLCTMASEPSLDKTAHSNLSEATTLAIVVTEKGPDAPDQPQLAIELSNGGAQPTYRLYKQRFVGLVSLVSAPSSLESQYNVCGGGEQGHLVSFIGSGVLVMYFIVVDCALSQCYHYLCNYLCTLGGLLWAAPWKAAPRDLHVTLHYSLHVSPNRSFSAL